ncbi:MAG TPA: Fic family protein [Rickettsia endosymbiont of Omalisus fontisbellaquei]|nr:Fic family protein [Rickettsia endosymbiont of Omalisus fontisbellaquei]
MEKSNNKWQDPYIDKVSGCLLNRFNIMDKQLLSNAETAFSAARFTELVSKPLNEKVDLEYLQSIHKYLFGDVYEWAGEIRKVGILKGTTRFAPASIIEKGSSYLFNRLSEENNLKGLNIETFSQRAGYYLGEINHLHPFREGNGRTQRTLITLLAYQNGYHIVWKNIVREELIEASIAAHTGNYKGLINIIDSNIIDRDYVKAVKLGNNLNTEAEIVKAESNKTYEGQIIGITDHYVVQALQENKIVIHNKEPLTMVCKELTTSLSCDQNLQIGYKNEKLDFVKLKNEKQIEDNQNSKNSFVPDLDM